jgi:hypothetical protein
LLAAIDYPDQEKRFSVIVRGAGRILVTPEVIGLLKICRREFIVLGNCPVHFLIAGATLFRLVQLGKPDVDLIVLWIQLYRPFNSPPGRNIAFGKIHLAPDLVDLICD